MPLRPAVKRPHGGTGADMRFMTRSSRERGMGKLTLLVFGTIVAAALYVAYNVLPFYYYYFELQEQMRQLVRVGNVYSDKELREKLRRHMERMEIPATIDAVKIERRGTNTAVSLEYSEVFYIRWQGKDIEVHRFNFRAHAEGEPE